MSTKSYFSDQECREAGFSEPMIRTLKRVADFVDTQAQLAETQGDVATLDGTLATAEAAIVALDARLDAYDVLDPFVRQDQTAAWADASGTLSRATFATYAGQTVSNPPTQVEVQAIDDFVKLLSQRVAALVNDLRAISALT